MGNAFSFIRDGIHFARTMTRRKLINYLILKCSFYYSILMRKPFHAGMPASLSTEPTTSCNLRCPECPSGLRQFTRPAGQMPEEDFKNIIDQLKDRLAYLLLYFQGEPFLNPDIFKMIRYASKNRIYTTSSTNGHYLEDDNARNIVASGLDRLIISMDGTDQYTYERYRRGGELDRVTDGIQSLVRWKKQLRSSRPYIILQFLVLKTNEHQIPAMKKLAKELQVDRLEFKSAQIYDFEQNHDLIPKNTKYSRYTKAGDGSWTLMKRIRNRCFRMWSGAVITWDGRVVPCCFDKDAKHQLGMLERNSFEEIWRSNAYDDFRKQLLSDRSKIDICMNCTE